jgi:hypothetical protein
MEVANHAQSLDARQLPPVCSRVAMTHRLSSLRKQRHECPVIMAVTLYGSTRKVARLLSYMSSQTDARTYLTILAFSICAMNSTLLSLLTSQEGSYIAC